MISLPQNSLAFEFSSVQFCLDVQDRRTPSEVLEALDPIGGYRGVRVFSCWMIPPRSTDVDFWQVGQTIFYGSSFKEWPQYLEEYTSSMMRFGPSALNIYARRAGYAFTVTEAMRDLRLTGEQHWIFNLLRRFGVRDGLFCPYRNWMVFYSSPAVLSLRPKARGLLFMAGGAAVGRMGELVKRPTSSKSSKPLLGERQLQILRLASYDKQPKEIAEHMQISVNTVNHHLKRIYRKLGVHTLAGAVAKAFRSRPPLLRADEEDE